MPRLNYAVPLDVLRRFDPTLTESDITGENYIGNEDEEIIKSRIEGVESSWDSEATPMRPLRIGSRGAPIHESARGKGFPVNIYLDHANILPFDSSEGDFIERRNGRDDWVDITGRLGNAWTADFRKGVLRIYRLPGAGAVPVLRDFRDRFVRLSYRIGAGGEYERAGQTTLSEDITDSDTGTVTVADASRLPASGGTFLLGGEEYAVVSSVDQGGDTVEIASRGKRRTSNVSHSSGDVIHYCPMDVREAVAAQTARELVMYDDFVDNIRNPNIDPQTKLDEWQSEWEETVGDYASY